MRTWITILNEIKEDKSHGALWLATRSIDAFKCLVESLWESSRLDKELDELVESFRRARPSMAPLKNVTAILSDAIKKYKRSSKPLDEIISLMLKLKNFIEESRIKVVAKAVEFLSDHKRFLTHSLSSTVLDFFKAMSDKKFVVVTESRPRCEGVVTAKQLASMGHKVKLIVDASAYQASKIFNIEVFVFGADSILQDGHLVNKVGTAQIALALADMGLRNVALCESIKVDVETRVEDVVLEVKEGEEVLSGVSGVEPFNLYFDLVPPKVLYAIVMEDGPHRPPFNLKPSINII